MISVSEIAMDGGVLLDDVHSAMIPVSEQAMEEGAPLDDVHIAMILGASMAGRSAFG
jgi:hypothetical protein